MMYRQADGLAVFNGFRSSLFPFRFSLPDTFSTQYCSHRNCTDIAREERRQIGWWKLTVILYGHVRHRTTTGKGIFRAIGPTS